MIGRKCRTAANNAPRRHSCILDIEQYRSANLKNGHNIYKLARRLTFVLTFETNPEDWDVEGLGVQEVSLRQASSNRSID